MPKRYNAEIVAGALLPIESKIIARLMIDGKTERELHHLIIVDNVLQKRSPGTAVRLSELICKRFSAVDIELVRIIAKAERDVLMQALLISAVKHSNLIGDFLTQVVKEKWRVFETQIRPSDWDEFLQVCEQIDPPVKQWKPSTRVKLGQVVRKCLVQAGYLVGTKNIVISPKTIATEIRQYLLRTGDQNVLDCLDIFS